MLMEIIHAAHKTNYIARYINIMTLLLLNVSLWSMNIITTDLPTSQSHTVAIMCAFIQNVTVCKKTILNCT